MIERGDQLSDCPAGVYWLVMRPKRLFDEADAFENVQRFFPLKPGETFRPDHTQTHWRWQVGRPESPHTDAGR
jgi:hypothetical protein